MQQFNSLVFPARPGRAGLSGLVEPLLSPGLVEYDEGEPREERHGAGDQDGQVHVYRDYEACDYRRDGLRQRLYGLRYPHDLALRFLSALVGYERGVVRICETVRHRHEREEQYEQEDVGRDDQQGEGG